MYCVGRYVKYTKAGEHANRQIWALYAKAAFTSDCTTTQRKTTHGTVRVLSVCYMYARQGAQLSQRERATARVRDAICELKS